MPSPPAAFTRDIEILANPTIIALFPFHSQIQRETNNEIGVDVSPEKPIYLDANEFALKLLSPSSNSSNTSTNNNRFLIKIYPVLDGKFGFYRQIALVPFTGKKPIGITIGRNEVTAILGWDALNRAIYYMSAPDGRPGQRHLYRIVLDFELLDSTSSDINIRPRTPVCLTCDNSVETYDMNNTYNLHRFNRDNSPHVEKDIFVHVNKMIGKTKKPTEAELIPNNCLYTRAHLSAGFSYYVLECLGPDTPSIYLVDSSLTKKILILNTGAELQEHIDELAMPQVKTFSVEIKGGYHAQVRLYLPPAAKEDEEVSFPLILHIDSTPGSQLVSEEFRVDWNNYLASQKSFIVAQIDGRGSGYQGEAFKSKIKGNISVADVEDQLTVLT